MPWTTCPVRWSMYERLFGAEVEHREIVPAQGVEAVSVLVGESRIELLRPLAEDTPVGKFLASRGPGMHHVAYLVTDIRASLRGAAAAGAELIDAEPRPGLFGLRGGVHPSRQRGRGPGRVRAIRRRRRWQLMCRGWRSGSTAG